MDNTYQIADVLEVRTWLRLFLHNTQDIKSGSEATSCHSHVWDRITEWMSSHLPYKFDCTITNIKTPSTTFFFFALTIILIPDNRLLFQVF